MDGFYIESEPWVGLLSAFGIVLALVGAIALRGASDRVRAIAAMAGAVLVGYVVLRSFGTITSLVAFLASGAFGGDDEGGRRVLDVILMAVGVAGGIAAVFYAHSRADLAAEDLADDDLVLAEPDDEVDDVDDVVDDVPTAYDEPDPYTLSRRRLVTARPWIDLGALVLAMALPLTSFGPLGQGAFPEFGFHRDVSAMAAVYLVVSGLVTAAALFVVAARTDLDPPLLAGCFGLLALRAVVVPIWPEFFANEFWSAFAFGLGAGLLMAAAFSLVRAAIPADRSVVVFGALAALALVTTSTALYVRASFNDGSVFGGSLDEDDLEGRIPDDRLPTFEPDVFPTELPTFPTEVFPTEFPTFPTDFPFTVEPAP